MSHNIILASGSPRRKEILSSVGIDFCVIKSDADENCSIKNPEEFVLYLSRLKGIDVKNIIGETDSYIISADTIVYCNEILGKPKDRADAFSMLKKLSANIHQVYTGVSIIDTKNDDIFSFVERTDVEFYEVSDEEIKNYINSGECDDKAGAYAIQGLASVFVKRINGDYNNVVGLPLSRLYQECKKRGINLKNV